MPREALKTVAAPVQAAELKKFSELSEEERWVLVQQLAERFGMVRPEDGASPRARKR